MICQTNGAFGAYCQGTATVKLHNTFICDEHAKERTMTNVKVNTSFYAVQMWVGTVHDNPENGTPNGWKTLGNWTTLAEARDNMKTQHDAGDYRVIQLDSEMTGYGRVVSRYHTAFTKD